MDRCMHKMLYRNLMVGIPGCLSGLAAAFCPGHDPEDQGSSPTLGSLHGACFSLCLCLCLSLSLFLMNKLIKSLKKLFKKMCPSSSTDIQRGSYKCLVLWQRTRRTDANTYNAHHVPGTPPSASHLLI